MEPGGGPGDRGCGAPGAPGGPGAAGRPEHRAGPAAGARPGTPAPMLLPSASIVAAWCTPPPGGGVEPGARAGREERADRAAGWNPAGWRRAGRAGRPAASGRTCPRRPRAYLARRRRGRAGRHPGNTRRTGRRRGRRTAPARPARRHHGLLVAASAMSPAPSEAPCSGRSAGATCVRGSWLPPDISAVGASAGTTGGGPPRRPSPTAAVRTPSRAAGPPRRRSRSWCPYRPRGSPRRAHRRKPWARRPGHRRRRATTRRSPRQKERKGGGRRRRVGDGGRAGNGGVARRCGRRRGLRHRRGRGRRRRLGRLRVRLPALRTVIRIPSLSAASWSHSGGVSRNDVWFRSTRCGGSEQRHGAPAGAPYSLLVPPDDLTHRQPRPQRRLTAVPGDHQPLTAPVRDGTLRPVLGPHHEAQLELTDAHLTVLVRGHVTVDPLVRPLLCLRESHHRAHLSTGTARAKPPSTIRFATVSSSGGLPASRSRKASKSEPQGSSSRSTRSWTLQPS